MRDNFRDHGELGAAVAVTIEGRAVVDLWAGWTDPSRTHPWERDTIVNVFSVGKGMAALALLVLVERGLIDLDAPVAHYWPEFAAGGKGDIDVRTLLSHRAGLPAIRRELPEIAMYDWDRMTATLAAEQPWWEPGKTHGYHANTFGFLIGEIVRRVSGASLGRFLQHEVCGPLGADFHFGIGPSQDRRIADFVFGGELRRHDEPKTAPDDEAYRFLLRCVYLNPPGLSGLGTVNTRGWRAAEIPSANGHANARAVARIYSALACGGTVGGVRLLRLDTIADATTEAAAGLDAVLRRPSRFGLGFQLTQLERPLGPNPRSFGHFGAGGSLGFADPEARLAFGYTMNLSGPRWQNPRVRALIDAVYASL
jgi:CubicO group peptidase (beta-lactamase class C family)